MNNDYPSPTSDDLDEYPKVTQDDLERAAFRVGLKPAPRKRRVTILLDTVLIDYFKAKAGERGYQSLINARSKGQQNLAHSRRHHPEGLFPHGVVLQGLQRTAGRVNTIGGHAVGSLAGAVQIGPCRVNVE